jgi:hypothetical protein
LFIEADDLTPVRVAEKADNQFKRRTPWETDLLFPIQA